MKGKFVVGRDASDINSEYANIGNKGGADFRTLSLNQIPSHTHNINLRTGETGNHDRQEGSNNDFGVRGGSDHLASRASFKWYNLGTHSHQVTGKTDPVGSNVPFDNRPSFYVIAYIIYKGL